MDSALGIVLMLLQFLVSITVYPQTFFKNMLCLSVVRIHSTNDFGDTNPRVQLSVCTSDPLRAEGVKSLGVIREWIAGPICSREEQKPSLLFIWFCVCECISPILCLNKSLIPF